MPKKKKADGYGTLLKHVRIPKDDAVSLEWFDRQQNIHTSIRMLIHRQVAQYGTGDTFSALSEEMMGGWSSAPKTEEPVRRPARSASAEPRVRTAKKTAEKSEPVIETAQPEEPEYTPSAAPAGSETPTVSAPAQPAKVSEKKNDRSSLDVPNPFKMNIEPENLADEEDAGDEMERMLAMMDD